MNPHETYEYYKTAWEKALSERTATMQEELDAALMALSYLEKKAARYREALEFYADPKHWEDHNVICTYDVIQEDDRSIPDECCDYRGGRRAREALKGSE